MSNPIQVLSRNVHGNKRWKRSSNLHFASRNNAVGLLADELPRAALVLPLAFIKKGECEYVPAAVLGLAQNENLLLDAQDRWIGKYLPAAFRAYPFVLARPSGEQEQDKRVLCVLNNNDAIVDGEEGTVIFDANGEPTAEVKKMLDFLLEMEKSRAKTERSVKALSEAGLIVPWQLGLKVGGETKALEGLFHVDEKALNTLPDEAYLKLRKAGAITLAHMMLLSEQNLPALGQLARQKRSAAVKETQH